MKRLKIELGGDDAHRVDVRSNTNDPWLDIGLLMEGLLVLIPLTEKTNPKGYKTKEEIVEHIKTYLLKHQNDYVYKMPPELDGL